MSRPNMQAIKAYVFATVNYATARYADGATVNVIRGTWSSQVLP